MRRIGCRLNKLKKHYINFNIQPILFGNKHLETLFNINVNDINSGVIFLSIF
jgi:hypothetical protein